MVAAESTTFPAVSRLFSRRNGNEARSHQRRRRQKSPSLPRRPALLVSSLEDRSRLSPRPDRDFQVASRSSAGARRVDRKRRVCRRARQSRRFFSEGAQEPPEIELLDHQIDIKLLPFIEGREQAARGAPFPKLKGRKNVPLTRGAPSRLSSSACSSMKLFPSMKKPPNEKRSFASRKVRKKTSWGE